MLAGAVTGDVIGATMICAPEVGSFGGSPILSKFSIDRIPTQIYPDSRSGLSLPEPYLYLFDDNGFGGTSYKEAERLVDGPLFDTHISTEWGEPTRLDIPHYDGTVDLDHATFGMRFEYGALCFFAGGIGWSAPILPGTYRGVADGIAFMNGIVYRLYGSDVVVGGEASAVEPAVTLVGHEFDGGILDTTRPVALGTIRPDPSGPITSFFLDGATAGFKGTFNVRGATEGEAMVGQFALNHVNGDVLFGVVALDRD